jgi:hypothetical protein
MNNKNRLGVLQFIYQIRLAKIVTLESVVWISIPVKKE